MSRSSPRASKTMNRLLLTAGLLLILPMPARQTLARNLQEAKSEQPFATVTPRVEALVAPLAQAERLSGVILVAQDDRIVFQQSYGFADWELRTPNAPQIRFGIASITKAMTEIVVEELVRAERLDLDAPVERHLPGFPKGPNGGIPTVGQLVEHRAGVPHRVTGTVEETQPLNASDIVGRVVAAGLEFEPGTDRLYSSAGFTSLARVIEVIEGKPFETILAERVFEPAGMASAISETGQGLMPRRARPYRLGAYDGEVVVKNAPDKDLRFLTGAGSVYATAEDLLHFVRAIHDGAFGDGLWGQVFDADATTWRGFTGRTNGYEASVDVLPSRDLVFVFLSNLRSAANWQVREQVRSLLLGEDPAAITPPPPVAEPFEEPESLVGTFGPAEITLVDGQLFRGDNEFYPIEGERYYTPDSGTIMRFRRDANGAVDALVSLRGSGEENVLPRSTGP